MAATFHVKFQDWSTDNLVVFLAKVIVELEAIGGVAKEHVHRAETVDNWRYVGVFLE